eukprot:g1723.t1
MPESAKEKRARKKREKEALKRAQTAALEGKKADEIEAAAAACDGGGADPPEPPPAAAAATSAGLDSGARGGLESVARGDAGALTAEQIRVASMRAVTGVLASTPSARDLKFASFSVQVGGNQLVTDCALELNQGCRYGLIGVNGAGKSNVLSSIAQRDVPLPEHVDVYHLHEEAPASDMTGVEAVIHHVREEAGKLEALSEQIIEEEGPDDERLTAIFERLDELDPDGSEPRARKILSGLGFCDRLVPMDRKTKHMSGGWRMRVSLAKALFASPTLLLLDEPTNHLDLEACVWLEEHLASYNKCLLVVSHSQDFLNSVCTDMIWLRPNPRGQEGATLRYYGGNYDTFVTVTGEEARVQAKLYERQQADMEKLATFVRVNKANGVASSAKSKKKVLEKVESESVDRPVDREPSLVFTFPECERLPPPVLPFDNVSFSYSGKAGDNLYEGLSLAVDYDSRVALVGPNGCGKSTLVKLMSGELGPTAGTIKPHQHLKMTRYHQHSTDVLDLDASPLSFMRSTYPPKKVPKGVGLPRTEEMWRSYLSSFGFSTRQQTSPIGLLSDGQRSRLVFAMLAMEPAGVLLLDEPTNHLDIDAVAGLAEAIRAFKGGVVLVSHDFRLIDLVANEIWVCEHKGVTRFDGAIREYKKILAKKMEVHKV